MSWNNLIVTIFCLLMNKTSFLQADQCKTMIIALNLCCSVQMFEILFPVSKGIVSCPRCFQFYIGVFFLWCLIECSFFARVIECSLLVHDSDIFSQFIFLPRWKFRAFYVRTKLYICYTFNYIIYGFPFGTTYNLCLPT